MRYIEMGTTTFEAYENYIKMKKMQWKLLKASTKCV